VGGAPVGGGGGGGGGAARPAKIVFVAAPALRKLNLGPLREQVVAYGLKSAAEASKLNKEGCRALLLRHLNLPNRTPTKVKSAAETSFMSASRMFHLTDMFAWTWVPEKMRDAGKEASGAPLTAGSGGGARATVLKYARTKLAASRHFDAAAVDEASVTEEVLIGMLSDRSAAFYSLWMLVDVMIMLAVLPFAAWTMGNMEVYLTVFPLFLQIIACALKPEVLKTMILVMYALQDYATAFPDIIKFFGANSRHLPETPIEYHHSRMKHFIKETTGGVNITHHQKASCLVKPASEARQSLTTLLLNQNGVS